jgi:serine phosphatase RsbU (regulator of sigma subunit)
VRRGDGVDADDRDETKRADYDIETSARIQKSLLAGAYDGVEETVSGIELYAEAIPSQMVDGDFYDFIPLTADSLDFLIGDVMGKGIPASLTAVAAKTAVYRSIIERLTREGKGAGLPRVSAVVSDVERKLARALIESGKFLTLCYCRADLARGLLSYVDAGHTGFCSFDGSTRTCWTVKGSNMPIGFAAAQSYREYLIPVDAGDILFFYSDGVSEAENAEGELFGEERIRRVVNAHSGFSPEELVKTALNLTFFFSACGFRDDVTALAVRVGRECPSDGRPFASAIDRSDPSACAALRERFFADALAEFPIEDRDALVALSLAFAEALANVVAHAEGNSRVSWRARAGAMLVSLDFDAGDFSWFLVPEPDVGSYEEHGFGSWIIIREFDSYVLLTGNERERRIVMVRDFSRKRGKDGQERTSPDFGR